EGTRRALFEDEEHPAIVGHLCPEHQPLGVFVRLRGNLDEELPLAFGGLDNQRCRVNRQEHRLLSASRHCKQWHQEHCQDAEDILPHYTLRKAGWHVLLCLSGQIHIARTERLYET